jgi:hypothetical protein
VIPRKCRRLERRFGGLEEGGGEGIGEGIPAIFRGRGWIDGYREGIPGFCGKKGE